MTDTPSAHLRRLRERVAAIRSTAAMENEQQSRTADMLARAEAALAEAERIEGEATVMARAQGLPLDVARSRIAKERGEIEQDPFAGAEPDALKMDSEQFRAYKQAKGLVG